ncbi:hypothetical protein PENARI_c002G06430 [Penicillium arizonense]|uniref:Uncharacterized protein n=1 Tax=Penicillium arizonense TaxID=1835702 RepID=A0A1F5LVK3_PENAI|nr:hypothetical protein PENARI_c002G06430 [Penicillium arizonense]OGE57188.1 hypothetical protein PENARI_c002G06430 [Penicillium arizonense]
MVLNPNPTPNQHSNQSNPGPVNAVTFSSYPGTYILTGSSDRTVHLTRAIPNTNKKSDPIETTSPIQKYEAHGYSVLDIAVAADNARFASVGGDRQVFLWDVEQGITTRRWSGHNSRIEAVQFAGEGDGVVVTGSADTTINLWDTRANSHKPIQTLTEATDTVSSLHVHMGSYSIASGSYDGHARIYDVRTGKTSVDVLAHPVTSGDAVVLSGSEAGGGGGDGAASFAWDVISGEVIAAVPMGEKVKAVSCVAWNEKGGDWAAGCSDGTVRVYG